MFVVLASRYDAAAAALVGEWGSDATIMTSRDLSARGWRYRLGEREFVGLAAGGVIDAVSLQGVLTRLPQVTPGELDWIDPADRAYVASEMTAFLAGWLSDLRCPVLNRPSPVNLMGPIWRRERWVHTATRLGLATFPARRVVPSAGPEPDDGECTRIITVNVVGKRCFGGGNGSTWAAARALADASNVSLLRARFSSPEEGSAFIDADYWIDAGHPEALTIIQQYFQRQARLTARSKRRGLPLGPGKPGL